MGLLTERFELKISKQDAAILRDLTANGTHSSKGEVIREALRRYWESLQNKTTRGNQ